MLQINNRKKNKVIHWQRKLVSSREARSATDTGYDFFIRTLEKCLAGIGRDKSKCYQNKEVTCKINEKLKKNNKKMLLF
jgi:hypothetical protein